MRRPQGQPWGPCSTQNPPLPTPRGSGTWWAFTGAPEASHGNVWLARQGKEPPTEPGVGRTKECGAGTAQRKPPLPPQRRARHPRQPQRSACATRGNPRGGGTPWVLGRQLPLPSPPPPQGPPANSTLGGGVGVHNRGVAPPPPGGNHEGARTCTTDGVMGPRVHGNVGR